MPYIIRTVRPGGVVLHNGVFFRPQLRPRVILADGPDDPSYIPYTGCLDGLKAKFDAYRQQLVLVGVKVAAAAGEPRRWVDRYLWQDQQALAGHPDAACLTWMDWVREGWDVPEGM